MSALKPGLYRAKVRGIRADAIVMVGNDVTYSLETTGYARQCYVIEDAHPLIVLDIPSGRARYVIELLRQPAHSWANHVADQIEAQTKPARIEEPGLWGVVEASVTGKARHMFFRDTTGAINSWITPYYYPREGTNSRAVAWADLIDPTLIRDGVTK